MANILLPEKLLQEQICSDCNKYLSYRPIKIYSNGQVKCGRCSTESDGGIPSNINKLFEQFLFPCVNRYEGCSQLLCFEDVPKHELTCLGKNYMCPMCPESQYKIPKSLLFLLNHYRVYHTFQLIQHHVFIECESPKEEVYLHCIPSENVLIFINIKFNFTVLSISPTTIQKSQDIKYKVKLYEKKEQKYVSSLNKCITFGLNSDPLEIDIDELLLDKCTQTIHCVFEFDTSSATSFVTFPRKDGISLAVNHKGEMQPDAKQQHKEERTLSDPVEIVFFEPVMIPISSKATMVQPESKPSNITFGKHPIRQVMPRYQPVYAGAPCQPRYEPIYACAQCPDKRPSPHPSTGQYHAPGTPSPHPCTGPYHAPKPQRLSRYPRYN